MSWNKAQRGFDRERIEAIAAEQWEDEPSEGEPSCQAPLDAYGRQATDLVPRRYQQRGLN